MASFMYCPLMQACKADEKNSESPAVVSDTVHIYIGYCCKNDLYLIISSYCCRCKKMFDFKTSFVSWILRPNILGEMDDFLSDQNNVQACNLILTSVSANRMANSLLCGYIHILL